MAQHIFDCVVDTTELAKSVHRVNQHIDGTTGAVVAMKTAVIAAETEGADHVCENVNRGFYALIHSQISQKMATLQSEVDAKLMRLNHQRKQLTAIRQRMQRDYMMICSRYGKIFNSINRALKQRVTALDQPIMKLATTDMTKLTNRENLLVGNVPVGQAESVKVSQRIATSNLKKRAADSIEAITRFIADSNRLDAMVNSILLHKRINEAREQRLAPVTIMESNFDSSGHNVLQMNVSQLGLSQGAVSAIENRLGNALREEEISWRDTPGIKDEINNQFRILVNSSQMDQRRKELIIKLFERSNFQTL